MAKAVKKLKHYEQDKRIEIATRLEKLGRLTVDGVVCVVEDGLVNIRENNKAHLVTWDTFTHIYLDGNPSWKGMMR